MNKFELKLLTAAFENKHKRLTYNTLQTYLHYYVINREDRELVEQQLTSLLNIPDYRKFFPKLGLRSWVIIKDLNIKIQIKITQERTKPYYQTLHIL